MTVRLWDLKTGKAVLVLRNQHEVGTVAFSPDGTLLAFGVWNEGIRVWALNDAPPPVPAAGTSGEIAFASDLDGDFEIWLMNADGSNQRQLTDNDAMDISPTWSPAGDWIVFSSGNNQQSEIYLTSTHGSQLQPLTANGAQNWTPAWRPTP